MTPEGRVKAAVKRILDQFKPVWYFMPVQGGYGKAGVPDFIVCANGNFFSVECKADGEKPTQLQSLQMSLIMAANGVAIVTVGLSETMWVAKHLQMMGCQPK